MRSSTVQTFVLGLQPNLRCPQPETDFSGFHNAGELSPKCSIASTVSNMEGISVPLDWVGLNAHGAEEFSKGKDVARLGAFNTKD